MLQIRLYTKPVCGLCDDLKAELDALAPTYPHQLEEVNIESDPALFEAFRFTIPVLSFRQDGEEKDRLQAPISRADLLAVFRALGQADRPTT